MTYLYRCYSDNDSLLYVGITENVDKRIVEHKRSSQWVKQLNRVDVEQHPDDYSARWAETHAIRTEAPLHNLQRPKGYPAKAEAFTPDPQLLEAIRREAEADPSLSLEQRSQLAILLLRPGGEAA